MGSHARVVMILRRSWGELRRVRVRVGEEWQLGREVSSRLFAQDRHGPWTMGHEATPVTFHSQAHLHRHCHRQFHPQAQAQVLYRHRASSSTTGQGKSQGTRPVLRPSSISQLIPQPESTFCRVLHLLLTWVIRYWQVAPPRVPGLWRPLFGSGGGRKGTIPGLPSGNFPQGLEMGSIEKSSQQGTGLNKQQAKSKKRDARKDKDKTNKRHST